MVRVWLTPRGSTAAGNVPEIIAMPMALSVRSAAADGAAVEYFQDRGKGDRALVLSIVGVCWQHCPARQAERRLFADAILPERAVCFSQERPRQQCRLHRHGVQASSSVAVTLQRPGKQAGILANDDGRSLAAKSIWRPPSCWPGPARRPHIVHACRRRHPLSRGGASAAAPSIGCWRLVLPLRCGRVSKSSRRRD